MFKFIRFIILSVLILMVLLPVSAQYDQDDIDQAECVHIEMTLDVTGRYIFIFIYQDEFNELLNGGSSPNFVIEVAEPGETYVFNVIVPPQTAVGVSTPGGYAEAVMFENGQFFAAWFGTVTMRPGNMDTECLGAATDGRLNRFDQQMLAVIYDDGAGGYNIWSVDAATSDGSFDYNVTRAEVDAALAAADSSGQAQTIASGSSSTLYALGGGQCQLNSPNAGGEMQVFSFTCSA